MKNFKIVSRVEIFNLKNSNKQVAIQYIKVV